MGLKTCLAGLVLVSDLSVTCFLAAGEMINLMRLAGEYRTLTEMVEDCKRVGGRPGISRLRLLRIQDIVKGSKIKLTYNNQWKKCKLLGDAPNLATFDLDGQSTNVKDYFETTFGIRLKYPDLPTINIGSKTRPLLIPSELGKI